MQYKQYYKFCFYINMSVLVKTFFLYASLLKGFKEDLFFLNI